MTKVDEPIEEIETTTPPAEEPEGDEPEEPEAQPTQEQLKAAEDRAKKAENDAAKWRRLARKAAQGKTVTTPEGDEPEEPEDAEPSSQISTDKRILLAQGMAPELLAKLEEVARFRKLDGLIEAQNDELFVAAKEKFEKDARSRDAGLSGTRGSGKPKVAKTLNTPGLSREEHKALVRGG